LIFRSLNAFGGRGCNVNKVARWFVFKPKIQIWVNFGGCCTGRCWYILWTLGPFYSLLSYFMDIWYTVRGNLVYFSRFGILYQEKSGNPEFTSVFAAVSSICIG
jgi:hypothetical protein